MKTGVIVYVVGGESIIDKDFDMIRAVRSLPIKADRVEVVSPTGGHFDVMDAWWLLTVKGMRMIICMIAEIANRSELKLTGTKLRLCG